jgi:tetratricopeptide (TPR) repeat protein
VCRSPSKKSAKRRLAAKASAVAAPAPASPPSAPAPTSTLARSIVYPLVLVTVLIVHWPVLSAQALVFDDEMYLFNNRVLMLPSWSNALLVVREVVHSSTIEGYYEPLTLHSLMLDVLAGGRASNLLPFHRTSLILHLVNVLLVMVLLDLLCRRPIIAALVALLFAVHPLTVEPLAWVWERKTLLATMFVLLTLIFYVRYVRTRWRWSYAAALLLFIPALLSKPTVTPLPVMLVLLDLWPLRRPFDRRAIFDKLPFFALALLFGIITIASTASTAVVHMDDQPGGWLRPIYLLGFYASKIVWPVALSCAYVFPDPMSLNNPAVLWRVLLSVLLVLAALIAFRRSSRGPLITAAWVLAGLLPTLGIVNYSWIVASDKYVYFPSIGLVIGLTMLLSAGCVQLERRLGKTVACTVIALACSAAATLEIVQTRRYLADWQDTVRLAQHMLTISPKSANVYTLLGGAYSRQGKFDEAAAAYRSAMQQNPESAAPHVLYAELLGQQGHVEEAVVHLEQAQLSGTNSSLASAQLVMARLRTLQGRHDDAARHLLVAVQMQPTLPAPRLELARAYLVGGKLDQAREQSETVLRLSPDPNERTGALMNLGLIAARQNRPQEAAAYFQDLLAIDPNDARAHFQLGLIAQASADAPTAIKHYRVVLAANPKSPAANNLAWILSTHPDDHLRNGQEALTLAQSLPPSTEALDTLAAAYAETGAFDQAQATAQRAIDQAKPESKPSLIPQLQARQALYKQNHPYREPLQPK